MRLSIEHCGSGWCVMRRRFHHGKRDTENTRTANDNTADRCRADNGKIPGR
jgi:hypothetical protein